MILRDDVADDATGGQWVDMSHKCSEAMGEGGGRVMMDEQRRGRMRACSDIAFVGLTRN